MRASALVTTCLLLPMLCVGLSNGQSKEPQPTVTLQVTANGKPASPDSFTATIPLTQSVQLKVLVHHLNGTVTDVTNDPRTVYVSVTPDILSVSRSGLVTATVASGRQLSDVDTYTLSRGRSSAGGVAISYGLRGDLELGFTMLAFEIAPKPNDVALGSMTIQPSTESLGLAGMAQLTVTRHNPDGSSTDITSPASGTIYASSSNGLVVDRNGLVTRIGNGVALAIRVINGNDISAVSFQGVDPMGPGPSLRVNASKSQIHEGDSVQFQVYPSGSADQTAAQGQNLSSTATGTVYTTFYNEHEDDDIISINQNGLGTTTNPIKEGKHGVVTIVARNGSAVGWTSLKVFAANEPIFDLCLKDSSTGSYVLVNKTTGDYSFTSSGWGSITVTGKGKVSITVTGKGKVSVAGDTVNIVDNCPCGNVTISFNGQGTGGATIVVTKDGGTYQTYHITATEPQSSCQ